MSTVYITYLCAILAVAPAIRAESFGDAAGPQERNVPSTTLYQGIQPSSEPYAVESTSISAIISSSHRSDQDQVPPIVAFTYNVTSSAGIGFKSSSTVSSPLVIAPSSSSAGGILSSSLPYTPLSSLQTSHTSSIPTSSAASDYDTSTTTPLAPVRNSTVEELEAYESLTTETEYLSVDILPSTTSTGVRTTRTTSLNSQNLVEPTSTSTRTHLATLTTTAPDPAIVGAQDSATAYDADAAGSIPGSLSGDEVYSSVLTAVGDNTLYQEPEGHPESTASSALGGGVVGAQVDGSKQWVQQGQWLRAACASGAAS
ncbi:hypothetical protein IAU59_003516 [Kwoniella sp. CBS 9459]